MVLDPEGPFAGFGKPTDKEIEETKKIIEQFKVLWPLLFIPLITWFKKRNKKGDITDSIEWIALTNFLTGYSDYIIAIGWILLARVNGTVNKLSYVFVGVETIPTVELICEHTRLFNAQYVANKFASKY